MSVHTSAIHWGTPSPQFKEWETTKVYFHGFENSTFEDSSEFTCLGHRWRLHMNMHPDYYIVLNLSHLSNKSITISYGVSIKNSANEVVETWESRSTFNVSDHEAIDKWDFYEHNSPSELEYGFINYSDL